MDFVILVLDDGGLVVDVREAKELQNDGVINKAVHIPLRQVKVKLYDFVIIFIPIGLYPSFLMPAPQRK